MSFTTLIDVDSLKALQAQAVPGERLVLLDCRFDLAKPDAGRQAYLTSHIPGARHADLDRDLAGPVTAASGRHPLPSPAALEDFLGSVGIDAATQVVAYDAANGSFAARAWWLLNWLGMPQVAVLDGGFNAWVSSGGALESGEADAIPCRSAAPRPSGSLAESRPGSLAGSRAQAHAGSLARPRAEGLSWSLSGSLSGPLSGPLPGGASGGPSGGPSGSRTDLVATADEVLESLGIPGRLLVDARAPERFAGSVEPLDRVAGHVPGAVNHPFTSNLGLEGCFLPAVELRQRWLARLRGTPPGDVTVMCGSGVTACHNLLAMAVAGLRGARRYAGSWSEWIRDPDRPVARDPTP